MPSQKTAEKAPEKKEKLIEVTAVRKFAIDYSKEKLKAMKSADHEGRDQTGMTKMIEVGDSAFITKEIASKLQDCGAVKIKL